MDKDLKLAALAAMAENDDKSHMAKCPKCGHKWMMSDDEYEDDVDEEGDEYED